jgi:NTP pyrophosphatase (non-canonical NTP hydrolase)
MIYYIYHIPGKKIGVTTNLKNRVEDQQGYGPGEYEILGRYTSIRAAADRELYYQRIHGYPVDIVPYDKLNCNKNKLNMKLNTTEQTTTFPCPANKLKGRLMDNIGMRWMTEHGEFSITPITIKWIMNNIKTSMFNDQRSYVYNKAFARFYDNNDAHYPQNGVAEEEEDCGCTDTVNPNPIEEWNIFDYIREWADERGLYDNGDAKTQALKLTEEVGETCRAILKQDHDEIVDGIGDCVVVLTNLAHLNGVSIEDCIEAAYEEIKDRTGKMENGTYKKD